LALARDASMTDAPTCHIGGRPPRLITAPCTLKSGFEPRRARASARSSRSMAAAALLISGLAASDQAAISSAGRSAGAMASVADVSIGVPGGRPSKPLISAERARASA
jgi:hypothetical protein